MEEFYYEKYENSALKLELAKVGYERNMKVLATKLQNEDEIYHGPIIEAIKNLRTALDEMIAEAKYFKAKYHEACEKED